MPYCSKLKMKLQTNARKRKKESCDETPMKQKLQRRCSDAERTDSPKSESLSRSQDQNTEVFA